MTTAEPKILNPDILLDPLQGKPRTISDWVTNFHLFLVAVDPFAHESSWILDTAARILGTFSGADCRVGWLVAGSEQNAHDFLGPLAKEFLTFPDPKNEFINDLGLQTLPALIHVNHIPEAIASVEGWNPVEWKSVVQNLANMMSWKAPTVPGANDPLPFKGSAIRA